MHTEAQINIYCTTSAALKNKQDTLTTLLM